VCLFMYEFRVFQNYTMPLLDGNFGFMTVSNNLPIEREIG
jgi:hypothetical protein